MNLHSKIMNIDPNAEDIKNNQLRLAYKSGHRDARHEAAELAIKTENRIEDLELALDNMCNMWRSVCESYGWDADHLIQYEQARFVLHGMEEE